MLRRKPVHGRTNRQEYRNRGCIAVVKLDRTAIVFKSAPQGVPNRRRLQIDQYLVRYDSYDKHKMDPDR